MYFLLFHFIYSISLQNFVSFQLLKLDLPMFTDEVFSLPRVRKVVTEGDFRALKQMHLKSILLDFFLNSPSITK